MEDEKWYDERKLDRYDNHTGWSMRQRSINKIKNDIYVAKKCSLWFDFRFECIDKRPTKKHRLNHVCYDGYDIVLIEYKAWSQFQFLAYRCDSHRHLWNLFSIFQGVNVLPGLYLGSKLVKLLSIYEWIATVKCEIHSSIGSSFTNLLPE